MRLGHLRLPMLDRCEIAAKRYQGIPFEQILDDIRDNTENGLKRLHLATRKDITNIEKAFGLRRAERHKDDATSVATWVQEMMNSDSNPVLLYKPQGSKPTQETPSLNDDDFILALQTPLQAEVLEKFGTNIICMDDTHGTNSYDFSLITVLVVDEFGEGYPVAWCLCNRTDKYILIDFLMAVRNRVGAIKATWMMTDDAEQFFSAWVAVFGLGPCKLLCTWHVDRAWRGALNSIKDKEVAAKVYHNLRVLLEETDIDTFNTMLQKTTEQLAQSNITKEFAKYFETYYSKRAEQWAACYRRSAHINTNMYVESFHRTLKYIYMKGRTNRRIDNLIHILLNVSRDKGFERLCKLEKGKISGRLTTIRKRHLTSNKLSSHLVSEAGDCEWRVKSTEADHEYTVTLESTTCQTECRLLCNDCGICIHMFSCTCLDFLINYTICKHIHLVAKRDMKQNNELYTKVTNNTVEVNVASLAEKCLSIRLPLHPHYECQTKDQSKAFSIIA